MTKKIKWKYRQGVNQHEGTVKEDDEPLLFICGRLCVTDLRESKNSKVYSSPKHYKIIGLSIEEAKQLAEDLVTGENFDKHEANRLEWIAEDEKCAETMRKAQEFLDNLKEQE